MTRIFSQFYLIRLVALTIFCSILGACGGASDPSLFKFSGSCNLKDDQKGSFMARVISFPLTVTADDRFNTTERAGIQKAVDQWNAFGQTAAHTPLFQLNFGTIPSTAEGVDSSSCSYFDGNESSFLIVKETDMNHWNSIGLSAYIPGVTFRCKNNSLLMSQIILIEDQIIDPTQVASVVVHELGHSLGLDHSCSSSTGNPDFIACSELSSPTTDPYAAAIMFPSLSLINSTGQPEIKEILQPNDQMRATCLYDGSY